MCTSAGTTMFSPESSVLILVCSQREMTVNIPSETNDFCGTKMQDRSLQKQFLFEPAF